MKWIEIIRADDDVIDWEILDWADARELWDKHYDETQKFSVIREILPNCSSAEILKEKYDFDMPGRNGIVYVIQTNNSELLREEIISHINNIIYSAQINQLAIHELASTAKENQVINFLLDQAVTARNMHLPAGFQGMAEASARTLEAAATELSNGHYKNSEVSEILVELVQKIHGVGIQAEIRKFIRKLRDDS